MKAKIIFPSLLLLLGVVAGRAQSDDGHNFTVAKNMDVFTAIYKNLDMLYVDTLDADEVIGNGINSMLRSLDPYTTYYPEDKMSDWRMKVQGKYAGIGAMIRYNMRLKNTVIMEPYEGMPAAEAGLKKGDIILAIDDSTMVGKPSDYVSERLRGDAGTTFVLKIKRPSTGKTMKMKLTRRAITTPAVSYYGLDDDGIGYIGLDQFIEDCSKDVRRAFIEMKKNGMRALVFDLRDNGGGLEQEAVNIVNMFVPKGKLIVSNRGKLKSQDKNYYTTVEPIDTVMPIVVLVNGNTASASEITSGALQDLDRAVVMGTRTYGKGLVQMTVDVPYNGIMMLTSNKYYIPSGRCIQARNYRHDRGGYVEHVPDSLTRIFHTAGGREVRDGGGIMRDVEVRPDTMSNISGYLQSIDSTETMHQFEVEYMAKHPTIAPAKEFELSDEDFEEFKHMVIENDFKYDRGTETVLRELKKIAQFEGYYDDAKDDFDNLEKKLKHNVERDLDFNRDEIKQIISVDLATAYYFQKGGVACNLKYDKAMGEARRLLNDAEKYNSILSGTKPEEPTTDEKETGKSD